MRQLNSNSLNSAASSHENASAHRHNIDHHAQGQDTTTSNHPRSEHMPTSHTLHTDTNHNHHNVNTHPTTQTATHTNKKQRTTTSTQQLPQQPPFHDYNHDEEAHARFPDDMTLTQLTQQEHTPTNYPDDKPLAQLLYPDSMPLTQLLQNHLRPNTKYHEHTHNNNDTLCHHRPPTIQHNAPTLTTPGTTNPPTTTGPTSPATSRKHRIPAAPTAHHPTHHSPATTSNSSNTHSTTSTNDKPYSPFTGDHRSSFWNAQGLFATDSLKQDRKWGYATHLCTNRDILGIAETHSNDGKILGRHTPHGFTPYWSHGTNAVGGVGLLLSNSFLQNFNPTTDKSWLQIIDGRVARLRLEGTQGCLDVYVLYLQSGNDADDRQARKDAATTIAKHMAPATERLSLVMGDFNFVTQSCDRTSRNNLSDNQDLDIKEAKHFDDTLWSTFHLHELHQPHETHENGRAYSRLDRIYSNHHVLDQLDRIYTCYTLPRNRTLSDHNAICFGRATPKHHKNAQGRIPESTIQHPDFTRRVITETHHLLAHDTTTNTPFRRLILTKQAMWTTHEGIVNEQNKTDEHNAPQGHNTEVGWILAYTRAADKQNLDRMLGCAKACPAIGRFTNPLDPHTRSTAGIHALKDHALSIARQSLAQEMAELQQETPPEGQDTSSTTHQPSPEEQEEAHHSREKKRSNITAQLKRMLPGSTNHIGAVGQEDGSVTSDPESMAAALAQHWAKVFKKKPINTTLLTDWFRSLRDARHNETNNRDHHPPENDLLPGQTPRPRQALPTNKADWAPTRRDMSKALRLAGNSSPGPDGIPFSAWRALGETGLNTLHDVACALRLEGSTYLLEDAYFDQPGEERHQYNVSNLVCLPKTPTVDDHGASGTYYKPKDTRPLSIVNCDNRLVASAARWRWEEHVGKFVKDRQQGFLVQRSILRNLLDMEKAMILCSCKDVDGAALFLDFSAAFPSVDQEYIMRTLEEFGIPQTELNFVKALYDSAHCRIDLQGLNFPGFAMQAGVRQGCPLSPLLYALVAEILLDKIELEIAGSVIKAYADDTAILIQNFATDAPILASIFQEFEGISGLAINMTKSYIIPLNRDSCAEMAQICKQCTPTWADMPVTDHCKYLGFMMGPGKQSHSWDAPYKKFSEKVWKWKDMPLGLFWDAKIHNSFLLPTLGYIAQLETPPDWVIQGTTHALKHAAKGPKSWAEPDDLQQLQEVFGLKASFKRLDVMAQAAQSRVLHWDRSQKSLTKSIDLWQHIQRRINNREVVHHSYKWQRWYNNSFLHNLVNTHNKITEDYGSIEAIYIAHSPHINDSKDPTRKKKDIHQSAVYQAVLTPLLQDATTRIHHKMARWRLHDHTRHHSISPNVRESTPAWQADRTTKRLAKLAHLTAPRVGSAVFNTIFNRWTTTKRYQLKVHACRFGCGFLNGDSIEHYCRCPVTRGVCRRFLNINPSHCASLHGFTLCSHAIRNRDVLTMQALLIYGVYSAFNAIKMHGNGFTNSTTAHECICQKIREGVSGHACSITRLANRWKPDCSDTRELTYGPTNASQKRAHRLLLTINSTQRSKRPRYDHLIHWLGSSRNTNNA